VERRTFPRTLVRLDAGIKFVEEPEREPLTGVVENISGGGILLRTAEAFPRGTRLEVAFPSLVGVAEDVPAHVVVEVVLSRPAVGSGVVSHCRFVAVSRSTLIRIIVTAPPRKRARPRPRTELKAAG
jgi:hypothetical protein